MNLDTLIDLGSGWLHWPENGQRSGDVVVLKINDVVLPLKEIEQAEGRRGKLYVRNQVLGTRTCIGAGKLFTRGHAIGMNAFSSRERGLRIDDINNIIDHSVHMIQLTFAPSSEDE